MFAVEIVDYKCEYLQALSMYEIAIKTSREKNRQKSGPLLTSSICWRNEQIMSFSTLRTTFFWILELDSFLHGFLLIATDVVKCKIYAES